MIDVACTCHTRPNTVIKWRQRFARKRGFVRLRDAPQRQPPSQFMARIFAEPFLAPWEQSPPQDHAYWDGPGVAALVGFSAYGTARAAPARPPAQCPVATGSAANNHVTRSHNEFTRTRFFGSLDGLRGLSILGVIWGHVWYVSGPGYFAALMRLPVLRQGAFGVSVFFAISGFLITTLLLRERMKRGRISLRDFYLRRALRIWPLYYATLALYVLLVLAMQRGTGRDHVFFHFLPGYLTFTYTWYVGWQASGAIFNFGWSLSVEEQFYIIWAVVLRVLRRALPVAVMGGLIALRAATNFSVIARLIARDSLGWRMAVGIAVPICGGAILAQALDSEKWFVRLRPLLGRRLAAPLALLLLVASLGASGHAWEWVQWLAACLLVGACVIREDNGLAPLLRWKPLAYMGLVSYGMYMLNTLVLDALKPVFHRVGPHHPLLQFPIALGVTVLAASLSYRFFGKHPFCGSRRGFHNFGWLRRPRDCRALSLFRKHNSGNADIGLDWKPAAAHRLGRKIIFPKTRIAAVLPFVGE